MRTSGWGFSIENQGLRRRESKEGMTYPVYVITLQETKIWKKRMRDKGDDEMITNDRV